MKNLFFFLLFTLFFSCKKEELSNCMEAKIESLKASPNAKGIVLYRFKKQNVLLLTRLGFDNIDTVYDSACNELCDLGGFAGKSDCDGKDFYENATLIRVVWEK